jgi:dihydroxy-acid dehydratase
MREMQMFNSLIRIAGLGDSVYLITDGRYSGYTGGACVGYLSPEAAEGGPIALVRDGDIISVDIEARALDLKLSETELEERRKAWKCPAPRVTKGYLSRYCETAGSAADGAIIRK